MKIIIGNIESQYVIGGKDNLLGFDLESKVRDVLRVRKEGYDRTAAYRNHNWDGYTRLSTAGGKFATGFIPAIVKYVGALGVECELVDNRENRVEFKEDFVADIGNPEGWVLRDYQEENLRLTLSNTCSGIEFVRGIANAATNYGKTSFMAGVINNIKGCRAIILCDRETFYKGTLKFLKGIYGEDVGEVSGKKLQLEKPVVVAMVGTLQKKLKELNVLKLLDTFNTMFLDECHRGGGDTVIDCTKRINAYVRLFVSGTPFDITSKYKKLMQIAQSGGELFKVSNMDLINKGVSLRPKCKFHLCVDGLGKTHFNYQDEYRALIVESQRRAEIILADILSKKKFTLIVVKETEHAQNLHEFLIKSLPPDYVCEYSHGKDKLKNKKEQLFKEGKINCLICTSILQEGANLPLIQVIWYAKGGKDKVSLKQFYGRGARMGSDGDHLEFNDFWDIGAYVSKHSRKRIKDLKKEGFEVVFNYPHNRQYTPTEPKKFI